MTTACGAGRHGGVSSVSRQLTFISAELSAGDPDLSNPGAMPDEDYSIVARLERQHRRLVDATGGIPGHFLASQDAAVTLLQCRRHSFLHPSLGLGERLLGARRFDKHPCLICKSKDVWLPSCQWSSSRPRQQQGKSQIDYLPATFSWCQRHYYHRLIIHRVMAAIRPRDVNGIIITDWLSTV